MNQISNILTDRINNFLDEIHVPTSAVAQESVHTSPLSISIEPTEVPQASTQTPDFKQTITQSLYRIKDEIEKLLRTLQQSEAPIESTSTHKPFVFSSQQTPAINTFTASDEKIIEGVFNGQKMIGPDGTEYAVPPNYASKSKLVEGDMMKLIITREGRFLFKQIGPIVRKRVIGKLMFDTAQQLWSVVLEDRHYKILTASATFYKGNPGDQVVMFIPEDGQSEWGAVENIIHSSYSI
ncbi:MAG: hypothetical protein WCW16_00610 [Candidatus Magasanikbacteria bacterium]